MLEWLLRRLARAPTPAQSEGAFRSFMRRKGLEFEDAPVRDVLLAVVQFYAEQRFAGLADDPDTDMLLFEYGCYDWGVGEAFQLALTRQFYSLGDNPISQLTVVFFYRPDHALRTLDAHHLWCAHPRELEAFRAEVFDSAATRDALNRTDQRREVYWEVV